MSDCSDPGPARLVAFLLIASLVFWPAVCAGIGCALSRWPAFLAWLETL